MAEIRTFIAVPTLVARSGLRSMLDPDGIHAAVVGESEGFPEDEALDGVEVVIVAGDEILGDSLPDGHGHLSFVILTDDGERALSWLHTLSPFGWGLLPPDASPEEVWAAILAASRGMAILPRGYADDLLEAVEAEETAGGAGGVSPPEPLTTRETEVLGLIAEGLPNKTIARELYISEHTVKFHLTSIFAKLGVSSRAGAVSRGYQFGLISL